MPVTRSLVEHFDDGDFEEFGLLPWHNSFTPSGRLAVLEGMTECAIPREEVRQVPERKP